MSFDTTVLNNIAHIGIGNRKCRDLETIKYLVRFSSKPVIVAAFKRHLEGVMTIIDKC